ncbi:LysR family transcriptional regulator [Nonomuraea sp. NPDC051941]
MDLLSLRYFQVVARHEHISRAAEELRVAQPSISREGPTCPRRPAASATT